MKSDLSKDIGISQILGQVIMVYPHWWFDGLTTNGTGSLAMEQAGI